MSAVPVADALDQVVAQLRELNVYASLDQAGLNLPGVIVTPAEVDWDRLGDGSYTLTADLLLVARAPAAASAAAELDRLMAACRQAFDARTFAAVAVNLPKQGADPLPGFRTSVAFAVDPDPDDADASEDTADDADASEADTESEA